MYETSSDTTPQENLKATLQALRTNGLQAVARNSIGSRENYLRDLGIKNHDFVITGFMGHRRPVGMPGLARTSRFYPRAMGEIINAYKVPFALLSGGGKPDEQDPEKSGLMGQWAWGLRESGQKLRFVSKQGLVELEGIHGSKGHAIILPNAPEETRIGARTDGLIMPSHLFVKFPGGDGTDHEVSGLNICHSLIPAFASVPMIVVDPVFHNPMTGEKYRLLQFHVQARLQNMYNGLVSPHAIQTTNNTNIVYRPAPNLTAKEMTAELVALTLAIRQAAVTFAPQAGHHYLPKKLIRDCMIPFTGKKSGSRLEPMFPDFPFDWSWADDFRALRVPSPKKSPKPVAKDIKHSGKHAAIVPGGVFGLKQTVGASLDLSP